MSAPLHLFQGYGVELEYMIVDRKTLAVLPVADQLLSKVAGEIVNEVERGRLCWSNELVLHVVELKTNGPAGTLEGLGQLFTSQVGVINGLLEPYGGMLMPGAMHPDIGLAVNAGGAHWHHMTIFCPRKRYCPTIVQRILGSQQKPRSFV